MSENENLSLQSHCQNCTSHCCSHLCFTVSEIEYQHILDAGHPNYLHKVEIPQGTYYFNDYRHRTCRYFDQTQGCTIQDVKPEICRSFPAQVKRDSKNNIIGTYIDDRCPASRFLSEEFKNEAMEIALQHAQRMTAEIHFGVLDAYMARYNATQLQRMQAKITYPLD